MVSLQLFSQSGNQGTTRIASRWAIFSSKTSSMIGLIGLVLISILTIAGQFLPALDHAPQLIPPAWHDTGSADYLLGTDIVGRDIFMRLIQGASYTLGTSLLSVSVALVVGVGLGLLAATYRSTAQLIIMRTMDVIFAIPSLVLALLVVALLGPGLVNAGIAVCIVLLPNFIRMTANNVIDEMGKEYVDAARLDGASPVRILFKSIMPNVAAPLILQTTIALSTAIVDIALLGFLGLGAQSPQPEWGTMLAEARTSMHIAPWGVTFPGLAILITVLFVNFIGDGLSRIIRSRKHN